MDHLGNAEECPILSCRPSPNVHGRAFFYFFYFYFLVASVNGSRNYLVMDIGILYSKFQEWLHLTLGEKGQIDLCGECTMLVILWGLR